MYKVVINASPESAEPKVMLLKDCFPDRLVHVCHLNEDKSVILVFNVSIEYRDRLMVVPVSVS